MTEPSDGADAVPAASSEDGAFEALLQQAARVSAAPSTGSRTGVLAPGATLLGGQLSIVQRLGEGGMGIVYEAFDARRDAKVALKTLTRMDAGGIYRLKNEFRALAGVTHPNLCALHELWSDGQLWCFTMELVEGERFDRWVRPRRGPADRDGQLDEARLRAALPQLLDAVAAIHAAGKLHRDLKPSNVLVTPAGRVVVLDFGLAIETELGAVGQTIADDSVSGTPAYMAPEQAAGAAASAASDFYALGVMLFEALSGRLPFEGRAAEQIVDKQRKDAPRVRELAHAAPRDLSQLCDALLSREPAGRPDTAALRAQLGVPAHGSELFESWRSSFDSTRTHMPSRERDAPERAPELLGRDTELSLLQQAFEATLGGQTVALFISGESGVGKSALCDGFLHGLHERGRATVLRGRCYERENVPFKGFDSLVDDLSRHLRRLPAIEATAVLPREVFALARIFPVLERVEVVAAAPKKQVPDPQDLKRRAFLAFGELLSRLRDRTPLVVLLDDVQWLDQDGARFLEQLLLYPEPSPLLLLCTHRSEGAADNPLLQTVIGAARDNAQLSTRALPLGPLSEPALAALAARLLPAQTAAATLAALAREAQGSPFFAAALARALSRSGEVAQAPSLAEALAAHVAALPRDAQRVLSLLALAGQPLSAELLVRAVELRDGHRLLDRLRNEQLVRASFDVQGRRLLECYHDKIREQQAAALDALQTQELSLSLSRALLADPEPDSDLLSRVLTAAGRPEQAAEHAALAAEQAAQALAFDRAAVLYAQALEQGRFEPARIGALRVALADALAGAGRGVTAAEAYLEAAATERGELAQELMRKAAEQCLYSGEIERGRALLGDALRGSGVTVPQSLPAAIAAVTWSRARMALRGFDSFEPRGEFDAQTLRELAALESAVNALVRTDQLRAVDFSARFARRALDARHAVYAARALSVQMMFQMPLGAGDERVNAIDALSERLCAQTGDAQARFWLLFYRTTCAMGRADLAGVISRAEESLRLLREHPAPTAAYDAQWLHWFRTAALNASARFSEVTEFSLSQIAEARARGDRVAMFMHTSSAVFALLAQDRPEHAYRLAEGRLLPHGEPVFQDQHWVQNRYYVACYRRCARELWYEDAIERERLLSSFQLRLLAPGAVAAYSSGLAAQAAREAADEAERRRLRSAALKLAKQSQRSLPPSARSTMAPPAARIACLQGDRNGAIAALRAHLTQARLFPLYAHLSRRKLGELLRDAEGQALIAAADSALQSGGVVDPARFASALYAGIELD